MVTKVYRIREKKVQKEVQKEVEFYEQKYVEVLGEKGYCGRCGTYYNYGDNPRDPDKCPKCVCIDCGTSIMSRKRTISGYAHSTVDRCYACWYKWYHHTFFGPSGRGYEISYLHRYPTKPTMELKRIPKKKMISETIEETIDEQVIYNPHMIQYSKQNKIVDDLLILDSEFKDTFYYTDSAINEDKDWFNCTSNIDAISKYQKINDFEKISLVEINSLDQVPYNEIIVDEKQVLEEFLDVVGFYPNVPAYIQGLPLNMYNNKRRNIVNIDKVINIYVNLAIDSKYTANLYYNRGIIVYSLISYLMKQDIKINLILLDGTFIDGETLILKNDSIVLKKNENKKEIDKQNTLLNYLFNILTDISYYRVLLINKKSTLLNSSKISERWKDGFGFCIKNSILRKILKIDDDTIVIGNIKEHNIGGYDINEDFINLMTSINIYSGTEKN